MANLPTSKLRRHSPQPEALQLIPETMARKYNAIPLAINADALHENDLSEDLRKGYDQALADWSEDDVIGSPYAIDEYIVAEDLGGSAE